jgi:PAS domain S-box-containing protein
MSHDGSSKSSTTHSPIPGSFSQTSPNSPEFFDYSPDFIAAADAEGHLTYLNLAGRRMIGFPDDGDITRLHFTNYIAPASLETFYQEVIPAARDLGLWQGELQLFNLRTGAVIDVHRSIFALRDHDGHLTGFGTITRDITAQKQSELELRRSEARHRVLHEGLRDPFAEVAMDGRIIDCNDLFCDLVGYSRAELASLTYVDLTPARWHAFEDRIVREEIIPHGFSQVYEKEYRRKDGSLVSIELRTILTRSDCGEPQSMWAVVRDISARKRDEAELRRNEAELAHRVAELETFLSVSPIGIALTRDPTCKSVWVNPTLRRLLRLEEGMNASSSADDADHLPFQVLRNGAHLDSDDLPMQRCCRTGEPVLEDEIELAFSDSSSRYLLVNAQPLFDTSGAVRGCIAFVLDITERRRAEDARLLLLRELNHRVKNLFALAASMIRLTARGATSVSQLVDTIDGRMMALARAHDCIRATGAVGTPDSHTHLAHLLTDLLAPHAAGTRIRIEGPAVDIGPTAAPILALAIHELATNAAKYGALSVPSGGVSLSWRVKGDHLDLIWQEAEGPRLAGKPDCSGFGSKLVRLTIERQLNGTVTYHWLDSGLILTATVPLSALAQ